MRSNKSASTGSMNLKKERAEWSTWLRRSLEAFKPPEKITVSEFADRYRILDPKTSNESGQWKTSRTPYLKGIMDAFNDPEIEEIIFCKPTQVGGTECLNNIIAWIIAQDPSATLIVYPTLELAEYTSQNRIKPMIILCPTLKNKYWENESKVLELQFDGMYIALSGANSPSSLASKPIRFLLMDEVDKYPAAAGKEADPRSLAKERTKTFPYNKKIFQTSTPTFKWGPIWTAWETADQQLKFHMPCPHCGHKQTFEFKQLKFSKDLTPEQAQLTARYECPNCGGIITDKHKQEMLRVGDWEPIRKNGTRRTAFHLNAFYSPWVRFSDIAYEYMRSKDDPALFMNFINSWLGQPFDQTEVKMTTDIVLEKQSEYPENIVPDWAMLLTGGIDVQKDSFYWVIRAWGKNMTSSGIARGVVDNYADIEAVMNRSYFNKNGYEFIVNLAAQDSGYNTDEVYEFCARNRDWLVPVKGSSSPLLKRYTESIIDRPTSAANGLTLYICDGSQYKNMIYGRLSKPVGPGCWMVFKGCDRDYADQISSEEKVKVKRSGREIEVWKVKDKAQNHWLDAEVYAAMAADLMKVRYLGVEEEKPPPPPPPKNNAQEDNWIDVRGNWI